MLDKLLVQLQKRQQEIEQGVFDSPPSDWPGFQKQLGMHMEVSDLIDTIKHAMSGREDDEP